MVYKMVIGECFNVNEPLGDNLILLDKGKTISENFGIHFL